MTSSFTQRIINFDDWREVVFFTVGSLFAVIVLGVVTWVAIGLLTWDSEKTVSGPVTVSTQWMEFSPETLGSIEAISSHSS